MAANMYLKFESPSIKGTSRDPGHEGEIELLAWSNGFPQRGPSRDVQASPEFTFKKYLDETSNELLKMCWGGKQIGKATLTCWRDFDGPPVEYLSVVMERVIISNYSISGGPDDMPVEHVSLEYGVITYDYKDRGVLGGAAVEPATLDLEAKTGA